MNTATTGVRVTDLQLSDIVADLLIVLKASAVEVDGVTIAADPHPAFDPAGAGTGESAWLVRLTDSTGRSRIAELAVRAAWREDDCWHLETQPAIGGGRECSECGTPTDDNPARCPDCQVIVTDRETYFGVHTASCGYWDERCRSCHTGLGPEAGHPDQPNLCQRCGAAPLGQAQDQP